MRWQRPRSTEASEAPPMTDPSTPVPSDDVHAGLTAAYAIDAPRLRGEAGALLAHARELLATKDAQIAEAAAEARAATLREVEAFLRDLAYVLNDDDAQNVIAATTMLVEHFNPEANTDDT